VECPNHCFKIFGYDMTAKEVIKEVIKDIKYYKSTGGGITISGGEPSVQYDFLMELLIESKKNDLHTCIETNGIIEFERFKEITKYVDLFLLDYKATGFDRHKLLTGCSNEQMLSNLKYLSSTRKEVVLRCPIIPGLNDTEEHFASIKKIKKMYSNIKEVEIMPYHSLGKSKWDSIGKKYSLKEIKEVDSKKKTEWEMKIK
jgi:pyruvate formate lyase activating enzyme